MTKSNGKSLELSLNKNSRRDFFKKAAGLGVGAIAAASAVTPVKMRADDPAIVNEAEWGVKLGKPVNKIPYGMPSPYEHNVVRRNTKILASGDWYASIAMCPIQDLSGIITPNGLFFTRTHGGVAQIDPNKYRLMIHGLVDKPLVLTLDELKRYPRVSRIHFIECPANGGPEWRGPQFNSIQFAKGMMSCAEWTGVYIKDIIKDLGLKPTAKWMLAEGSDNSEMARSVPIDKVLDDAMLVYAQNGEALRPEQGYPVRLLLPGWEGNLCVKWVKRLEFSSEPFFAKEESAKYTALKPNGKAIQHFYPLEVNSVITSPCPEKPWTDLKKGDIVEIEGLAWSGQGTIKGVDITFDGGKNWVKASLKGLVLPRAWTRFSYIYKWAGKEILLASRAYDDAGGVQPTIDEEVAAVGVESVYHRNSIQTWKVTAKGKVFNVQVRSPKKEEEDIKKLRSKSC